MGYMGWVLGRQVDIVLASCSEKSGTVWRITTRTSI